MSDRPDYSVGDLVVCVSGPRSRLWSGMLMQGRVYRVAHIYKFRDQWGACVEGITSHWTGGGFAADAFRKVDPLPDSLTELLASKPVRDRVSA